MFNLHNRLRGLLLGGLLLGLVTPGTPVIAAAPKKTNKPKAAASQAAASQPAKDMTAAQFEAWANNEFDRVAVEQTRPVALEKALRQKLLAGLFVTDNAVLATVNALGMYEGPALDKPGVRDKEGHLFPDTHRLIDAILPFTFGRDALRGKLHQKKAQMYRTADDLANCAKEYQEAVNALDPVHRDVDERRMQSHLEMGGAFYIMGDKKRAEEQYDEVLSYDWTNIREAQVSHRLKDLYVRAGRGLIEVLRGDAAKLDDVFFISATMEELGPVLEEAKREAAKK